MTPVDILHDTVTWYTRDLNRRAVTERVTGTVAHYKTPAGKCCGVGRAMTLTALKLFGRSIAPVDVIIEEAYQQYLNDPSLGSPQWLFQPEYRGWSKEFWFDLQKLHDLDKFWFIAGLTTEGRERLQLLQCKYANPDEHRCPYSMSLS